LSGASSLVPLPVRRAWRYHRAHGRLPHLLRPRSFTDKLNWRISFDRRDILASTCYKLAMKEHARREAADLVRIPRTYWVGTDVGELAGLPLPDRWVLKPNHSCMRVLFGEGPPDPARLAVRTAGWVQDEYWRKCDEWAYRLARQVLLVEDLVGIPGEVPADLKVLVFDGVPRLISVHTARQDRQSVRLYTPDWEPVRLDSGHPMGPDRPAPTRLADMLAAAAVLAAGHDMLRVDFYEHDGVLWFGELTPYPGAGLVRLHPELDELLGSWWSLPRLG
jgi:hypothetical protein